MKKYLAAFAFFIGAVEILTVLTCMPTNWVGFFLLGRGFICMIVGAYMLLEYIDKGRKK
jgi:hypothetical protein